MNEIYSAALALLSPETAPSSPRELETYNELIKLNGVDLDKGQFEFNTDTAVQFPYALIKTEVTQTEAVGNNMQRCYGKSTIRLAFDFRNSLAEATPTQLMEQNTAYYNLANAVYLALQGKKAGSGNFERLEVVDEKRSDGLKVTNLSFSVTWIDQSAKN